VMSGTRAPLPIAPSVSSSVVSATIKARGSDAGIEIYQSDRRLALGRRSNGRYGLEVLAPGGRRLVAGIGESEAGSGIAMVADAAGNPRVTMSGHSESGTGRVVVANVGGKAVATLSADGFGGSGLLQLTNASGTVMVSAGTLDGVGMVSAGPGAFQHGIMFLGLPASYIVGKP
jgi:hypothetical protein